MELTVESRGGDPDQRPRSREPSPILMNGSAAGGSSQPASGRSSNTVNPQTRALLEGRMENLPPVASKTVRVFLSSTFRDMVVERNVLMESVYPKLKNFCHQYGLEFQVVDMRWGIREEAQDDHMTTELCLKEIRECQRISIGPTFVAIFGQKYGYRPFPVSIDEVEFQKIRSALIDEGQDTTVMDDWFILDKNRCPPVYSLLPITTRLEHWVDRDNPDLQEQDRQRWWRIFEHLQTLLRDGANICRQRGALSEEERAKYFISVTDCEVREGIMLDPIPGRQVIFIRSIGDLMDQVHKPTSHTFIDMVNEKSIDSEAHGLLLDLRDNIIPNHVEQKNIENFQIKWSDNNGINMDSHANYLSEFRDSFYEILRRQILEHIERHEDTAKDELISEILQHLNMCERLCERFHGRQDIMDRVKAYMSGNLRQPMVIHGESGVGKTSIMAMFTKHAPIWFDVNNQPVVVTRFLGTTAHSSGIYHLLQSICLQISRAYDAEFDDVPNDFNHLVTSFHDLLQVATKSRPLVIILDSLDQLSTTHSPNRLTWMPWKLPENVSLLISTLPHEQKILTRLKMMITNEENFIEIPPLGHAMSYDIIMSWLKSEGRTLTQPQAQRMKLALTQCSLPLYTKLLYEEVRRWRSHLLVDALQLEHTIKGLINALFDRIELHYGKVLVSRALGYLSASRSGLTEAELEDLLSLDDEVLDEVFVFWVPPVRRIPPLLWTRIRNELTLYLVEREADQVNVIVWYHRQFLAAARSRYLADRRLRLQLHSALADYFMGKWGGGKKKPFRYSSIIFEKMKLQSYDGEADRKLPAQPLKWKTKNKKGVVIRYNLRKLTELPYHLYMSERYNELWQEVLYNYRWLHAKLKATSVVEVLADAMLVHKAFKNHRLGLLMSALRVAGNSLKQLPNALAAEILGRMKPHSGHDMMDRLLKQCESEGLKHCALLPAFPCYDAPMKALIYSLEGHRRDVTDLKFSEDGQRLYSVSVDGTISVWDTQSSEQLHSINVTYALPEKETRIYVNSDSWLAFDTYKEASPIRFYNGLSGVIECNLTHRTNGYFHDTVLTKNYCLRCASLIRLDEGEVLRIIPPLAKTTCHVVVAITPDEKLIVIGEAKYLLVYDIESDQTINAIAHNSIPSTIVITADSKRAIVGYSVNCLVIIYDIDPSSSNFGKTVMIFNYQKAFAGVFFTPGPHYLQSVFDLVLSEDETLLLVNVKRTDLFVVNLNTNQAIMLNFDEFKGQEVVVHSCGFLKDAVSIVAIVTNHLCIWCTKTGQMESSLRLTGSEFVFTLHPSSNIAATVAHGETNIKLWDLNKLHETEFKPIHIYNNPVDQVVVVPQKKLAFVKVYRRLNSRLGHSYIYHFGLDVWNLATNQRKKYLPYGAYGRLILLHASIDGKLFVMVTETKSATHIYLVDVVKDRVLAHLNQTGCHNVQLSANCRYLLTESGDEVKLWNLQNAELMKIFTHCQSCAFTTESKFALFIHDSKRLLVFQLETREIFPVNLRKLVATAVSGLPKGPGVAMVTGTGNSSGGKSFARVEMWDFVKGTRLCKIDNVCLSGMMDVSKNGRIAVDGHLQVFDIADGKLLWRPRHELVLTSLMKVTDDGRYMVWADTAPADCIKVMEVQKGQVVAQVSTHSQVMSLNLADHGYLVVVGCEDGHLLTFRLHKPTEQEDDDSISIISSSEFCISTEGNLSKSGSNQSLENGYDGHRKRSISTGSNNNLIVSEVQNSILRSPQPHSNNTLGRARRSGHLMLSAQKSLSEGNLHRITNNHEQSGSNSSIPSMQSEQRSASGSNLNDPLLGHRMCEIDEEDLARIDPIYRKPIDALTDDELPSFGEMARKTLERAAMFSYSISGDSNPAVHAQRDAKTNCRIM